MDEKKNKNINKIFIAALLIVFLLVLSFLPDEMFTSGKTLCIHKWLFGIECPLCGMTRALRCSVQFNFVSAIIYNPAVIVFIVFAVVYLIEIYIQSPLITKIRKILFIIFLISIAIVYGLRLARIL